MTGLVIWSVGAFGLSWILADSKISFPVRAWMYTVEQRGGALGRAAAFTLALVECVACTGFHLGWIGSIAGISPVATWWMSALFTCGSSLILAKVVGLLDQEDPVIPHDP